MSRIKLLKGQQSKLLDRIGEHYCFDWSKVAKVSNVCERALRDWRSEKYNMSYEALLRLQKIADIPIPKKKEILPEYWSARKFARKGALRRYQIYGNLGTPEGRKRGGITSQKLFRLNPEYAKSLGIRMRKDIRKPKPSIELAEFIGIMLGDGGMTNYQINVTFNTKTDNEYGIYIRSLIKRLFNISASLVATDSDNADRIVASGINLVEFLLAKGLKIGNKVKNRVNVPRWVLNNRNYSIACLRGLVDTDGSFYHYNHKVYNKKYCNFAMCFTSYSKPLLTSVYIILKDLNFNPVMNARRVYLHKRDDIDKYFLEIGTHNKKHLYKYKIYLDTLN
ncbi:MAG: LAGLIDADG family homing endonuclease [Candidatus Omnitrophota bacterium]|nr:LAGLIDADG family homing endonuclease [Candidatus Omnitrophota bacterium]